MRIRSHRRFVVGHVAPTQRASTRVLFHFEIFFVTLRDETTGFSIIVGYRLSVDLIDALRAAVDHRDGVVVALQHDRQHLYRSRRGPAGHIGAGPHNAAHEFGRGVRRDGRGRFGRADVDTSRAGQQTRRRAYLGQRPAAERHDGSDVHLSGTLFPRRSALSVRRERIDRRIRPRLHAGDPRGKRRVIRASR